MAKVFLTRRGSLAFTVVLTAACHWTLPSGSQYLYWHPFSFQFQHSVIVLYNHRSPKYSPAFRISRLQCSAHSGLMVSSMLPVWPIHLTFLQLITPLQLSKEHKLLSCCVIFSALLTAARSAGRNVYTIDCSEVTADLKHFVECSTCSQHNGEYFACSQCLDCLMTYCCTQDPILSMYIH